MLQQTFRIPSHVVFRTFVDETVVLNLKSGQYHGLNHTAGRMLELLAERSDLRAVAHQLATEMNAPEHRVLSDTETFFADLAERGLVERDEL